MDIGLLRTFLEVNRTRHFGQAADNLYLTQSAVSARIRLLEQTLGVSLFTRERNNIELTPAGLKLLKYADTILNTWNRARQDIVLKDDKLVPLSVGGVPSLWDIVLQDWLNNVYQRFDNILLHAEVHGPEALVKKIVEGSLDVAFLFEALQLQEIELLEIASIDLVLVSSEKDLSLEQALNSNYVLVNWGTSFAISHAQLFSDLKPPVLHAHLGRLAHEFILQRGGGAYLAESMVHRDIKAKRLFRVKQAPVLNRKAYAAIHNKSERKDLLMDLLAASMFPSTSA